MDQRIASGQGGAQPFRLAQVSDHRLCVESCQGIQLACLASEQSKVCSFSGISPGHMTADKARRSRNKDAHSSSFSNAEWRRRPWTTEGASVYPPIQANITLRNLDQSSFSGSIWMFCSPAAFLAQYFLTHASKVLPAAVSRPVNASAPMSE